MKTWAGRQLQLKSLCILLLCTFSLYHRLLFSPLDILLANEWRAWPFPHSTAWPYPTISRKGKRWFCHRLLQKHPSVSGWSSTDSIHIKVLLYRGEVSRSRAAERLPGWSTNRQHFLNANFWIWTPLAPVTRLPREESVITTDCACTVAG